MAVELVRQLRDMFGAPAPFRHVVAVALRQQSQGFMQRPFDRLTAIGIRLLCDIAPLRMIGQQRE